MVGCDVTVASEPGKGSVFTPPLAGMRTALGQKRQNLTGRSASAMPPILTVI
jgi:hypothetical protein